MFFKPKQIRTRLDRFFKLMINCILYRINLILEFLFFEKKTTLSNLEIINFVCLKNKLVK